MTKPVIVTICLFIVLLYTILFLTRNMNMPTKNMNGNDVSQVEKDIPTPITTYGILK